MRMGMSRGLVVLACLQRGCGLDVLKDFRAICRGIILPTAQNINAALLIT